ncbi:MAG: hypothetical protein RMJ56_12965 [Gemmataceae bacterium]|nr:hypothetical protein [Gemmata sp.]MDW8198506.1 hypothetical protein [Gemmataceae bacterium]
MKHRRSLSHVGGPIITAGARCEADGLAAALAVPPATDADNDPARSHVHGFHTYPARLHPLTAARLVKTFGQGGPILDPFCGSGTVLVEALIAGCASLGSDLNPLAVRLATGKTRLRSAAELEQLVACAQACALQADERRCAKAGASRRFPAADVALFEPHVLLELDSLRLGITACTPAVRSDLELVLSAILVKLSRKESDTTRRTSPRRLPGGYATQLFVAKTREFATRCTIFQRLLPPQRPPVTVLLDDATQLERLPDQPVAAIITSPPYAATYDYLAHHELRMRWLGLDPAPLARGEIGSRSTYARLAPAAARQRWRQELERFFQAATRLLKADAPLVVVMADSAVGSVALRADELIAEAGRASGWRLCAQASQARPHFHGPTLAAFRRRPRYEHAFVLRQGSSATVSPRH